MAIEDDLWRQRNERLAQIRALGFDPYGQAFDFTHTIPQILESFGPKTAEELVDKHKPRSLAAFSPSAAWVKPALHLQQNGERLQALRQQRCRQRNGLQAVMNCSTSATSLASPAISSAPKPAN